MGPIGYIKVH